MKPREEMEQVARVKRATIDRRSVMGLAVAGLAGSLVACRTESPQRSASARSPRRRFEGKVVLITGTTSSNGRAAAIQFTAEGARVTFCGRQEKLRHEVEGEIRSSGGEAAYIRTDVRNESEVQAFVGKTVEKYCQLNVAFNNAGITLEKPLQEYGSAEWDDVMNTNLLGVFLAMKYEIPHVLAAAGGNIVVTSSSNAIATTEKRSAYTASKRGLVGLVQAAAQDYVPHGIRVNALIPGPRTPSWCVRQQAWSTSRMRYGRRLQSSGPKSHVPSVERMAKAEEIAAFALVLASEDHPT